MIQTHILSNHSYRESTYGALLRNGIDGSSMLLYNPLRYSNESIVYDQQLKQLCCGEAGLCDQFYERRPADNCELYKPQSWGELKTTMNIIPLTKW